MTQALTLTPVELLLRISQAAVGAGEQPPNTNRGPYIKRVLARCGLPEGHPWCAAVVTDWGLLALGKAWPVPRSASVVAMAVWAQEKDCRFVPSTAGDGLPQVGDFYVLYYKKKERFAHIGLVVGVDGLTIKVRDGNTSDPHDTDLERQREGWGVFEKTRTLTMQDRLIRWTLALP